RQVPAAHHASDGKSEKACFFLEMNNNIAQDVPMSKLLRWFVPLFLTTLAWNASAADLLVPKLPASGKTIQDFVPKNWNVLKKAEGDLNKDGLPDVALALNSSQEDEAGPDGVPKYIDAPRILAILFKTPDGYQLSTSSTELIIPKTSGGAFGDPFADLKI